MNVGDMAVCPKCLVAFQVGDVDKKFQKWECREVSIGQCDFIGDEEDFDPDNPEHPNYGE